MFRVFTLIIIFLFVNVEKSTYASNSSEELGSIDFFTSVSGTAQTHFLHGVAALHSFWYTEALGVRKLFSSLVVLANPSLVRKRLTSISNFFISLFITDSRFTLAIPTIYKRKFIHFFNNPWVLIELRIYSSPNFSHA